MSIHGDLRGLKPRLRREVVKEGMIQKFTQRKMAEELGVSEKTIERDFIIIRKELNKKFENKDFNNVLIDFTVSYDAVAREAWKIYRKSDITRDKINALKLISDNTVKNIQIMQTMGMAPKIAEQIEVKGDIMVNTIMEAIKIREANKHGDKSKPES